MNNVNIRKMRHKTIEFALHAFDSIEIIVMQKKPTNESVALCKHKSMQRCNDTKTRERIEEKHKSNAKQRPKMNEKKSCEATRREKEEETRRLHKRIDWNECLLGRRVCL